MVPQSAPETPDWRQFLDEWAEFEPDEDLGRFDSRDFGRALVRPLPDFVDLLMNTTKNEVHAFDDRAMRLYFFLLKQRYEKKHNLLHFAFHVFTDDCSLPAEVIEITPFPHEDGFPPFRYFGDPSFRIPVSLERTEGSAR